MMNEENYIDLIDRFLKNQLEGEELREFQEKLNSDPAFNKEVELQRRLIVMLKAEGLRGLFQGIEEKATEKYPGSEPNFLKSEELRNTFNRLEKEVAQEDKSFAKAFKQVLTPFNAIAAAVAFLVIAGSIIFFVLSDNAIRLPEPKLSTIIYQGDANPPFPSMAIHGSHSVPPQYAPVLIYPSTERKIFNLFPSIGKYNFHYQFDDTLRLYGNFDKSKLSISYRRQNNQILLKIDSINYLLERKNTISPLKPLH